MTYSIREALAAFRRAPLLVIVSILAVALSLSVVGLFGLTAYNVRTALERIEERVEVVAYLDDGVSESERARFASEVAGLPEVQEVRYVSKTEAMAMAIQDLPEFRDVFTGLNTNPLPASFEIRVNEPYRNTESTERLAERVGAYAFVEEVDFGEEWVEKIESLQRIAAGATTIVGGAFALVAGIVIATAIRIAVFARREEIEIMRLVGATDGFIRRPFVIEGVLAGLIGGVLAIVLTWAAFQLVDAVLIELDWIPAEWLMLTVVAGAAYGLLASSIAVRRHLGAIGA